MESLIQKKVALRDQCLEERGKSRFPAEAVLIGGDAFTMGYLALQSAELLSSSLAASPVISWMNFVCGEIGGAINIGVSFVCLSEGLQAMINKDYLLASRLFCDFATLFAIGTVMLLSSLSTKVAALGLSAFFTANPWLLPLAFFLMSLPTILDVSRRVGKIWLKTDLASQLSDPKKMAETHFSSLNPKDLEDKLEEFQAEMGVDAAIETFKLMQKILSDEKFEEQLERAKEKAADWSRAQYVRLAQQILYTTAFGVGMGTLSLNNRVCQATQNIAMTGANAIPLYMDTFWPFKRNTPIVVPKVVLETHLASERPSLPPTLQSVDRAPIESFA
jgi:hypothetical protein